MIAVTFLHPTSAFSIGVVAVDVLRLPSYLRHRGSLG